MHDPNNSSELWPSEHVHTPEIMILNAVSIHPSRWVIGMEFNLRV